MKPKSLDDHPMQRMSECRVRFGNCGRSFLSPAIYKSVSAKIIVMFGYVFQDSSHFRNASTHAVPLTRFPSWVHWYRFCIVSRVNPQRGQRLVVACLHRCRIFMVGKVLLMYFVMMCSIWTVVVYRTCFNGIWSVSYQSSM